MHTEQEMIDIFADTPKTNTMGLYKCVKCGKEKLLGYMHQLQPFPMCDDCAMVVTSDNIREIEDKPQLGDVLHTAKQLITGDRQDTYGNPEFSFNTIASYWTTYLRSRNKIIEDLSPQDTLVMMTLLKIARESHQHKKDNVADAIGYLAILDHTYKE